METKFTKGEWKILQGKSQRDVFESGRLLATAYNNTVSKQNIFLEEAIANAKLIAAAPDMFNALEELLAQVKQFTAGNIGEQDYFRDEISNAKKAIKKATE